MKSDKPKLPALQMTAAEYREYVKSGKLPQAVPKARPEDEARRPVPGSVKDGNGMNKLEAAYAAHLEALKRAGLIEAWRFEPMKLRLAAKTTYSPDFLVVLPNDRMEFHETKGFMREDANVKLKVAASLFPWFTFRLVRRKSGAWEISEVAR